jgi:amino acid transporter
MIQRIQTVYLALSMIFLSIVVTGSEIVRFVGKEYFYTFNSFGLYKGKIGNEDQLEKLAAYPFFISLIALVLFMFITLMGYKNLKRQLKLARTSFYVYLLLVIAVVTYTMIGASYVGEEGTKRELGLGFFLLVAGLPFAFLGNLAIKRDKALIDSLNRLR